MGSWISRNEASQPPIAKDREETGIGREEVYNVIDRAGVDTFANCARIGEARG